MGKLCLAKNRGRFEFSNFFAKIEKLKNANISKTVLDIAIWMKYLTHRVSLKISHPNFEKKKLSRRKWQPY